MPPTNQSVWVYFLIPSPDKHACGKVIKLNAKSTFQKPCFVIPAPVDWTQIRLIKQAINIILLKNFEDSFKSGISAISIKEGEKGWLF